VWWKRGFLSCDRSIGGRIVRSLLLWYDLEFYSTSTCAHSTPFHDVIGYCEAGFCSSQPILGTTCATNVDCDNSESGTAIQYFCSPGGICGGGQARCEPDFSNHDTGENDACVSGKPFHVDRDMNRLTKCDSSRNLQGRTVRESWSFASRWPMQHVLRLCR
jgi:hypothetical protein